MFDFKKKPQFSPVLQKLPEATQVSDLDLLKKQIADQELIIRELFEMTKLMANHKRYEYIQKKIDTIQNYLDKLQKWCYSLKEHCD